MNANPSILVIDDDQGICDLVSHVGESVGYDTHILTHPEDIIGVDLESFSIIVLDLCMPGIEGMEIIDHLGRIGCSVALVIMSGLHLEIIQKAAKKAEMNGLNVLAVLEKPVPLENLNKLLSEFRGSQ